MAYFQPLRTFAASWLVPALLLSGCCANNVCDCNDTQADAVRLRFSSAFSTSDLDTIVLKRYPLPFKPTAKFDSVTLVQPAGQVRDSIRLVLNNTTPFAQAGTGKLNQFRYVVQLRVQPPHSKPVPPITALVIDSVGLRGSLGGTGCCTCYTNTMKTVYAKNNGATVDSVYDLRQKPYVLKVTK
ncbi:MAG: hypothetical protein NVS3B25_25370 [Hymenobacter sp.]